MLREVPDPVADAGQTLVEVRAAGVNYADVLIREGRYPQPPPLPFVPGSEIAGVTADGRRVIGFVRPDGGGYAERAVVEDDWLFDLPEKASFEQGAAFLLAFLTAWIPLTRQVIVRARRPGSRHGRGRRRRERGGAGRAGARRRASSAPSARREKLDHVLGRARRRPSCTRRSPGSSRSTSILDQVGGDVFAAGLERLRPLGTIVGVGFAGGPGGRSTPRASSAGTPRVAGFYLGRLMKLRPDVVRDAAGELLERWADGALSPTVGATFPLGEADAALRMVAERRSTGKVVLVP